MPSRMLLLKTEFATAAIPPAMIRQIVLNSLFAWSSVRGKVVVALDGQTSCSRSSKQTAPGGRVGTSTHCLSPMATVRVSGLSIRFLGLMHPLARSEVTGRPLPSLAFGHFSLVHQLTRPDRQVPTRLAKPSAHAHDGCSIAQTSSWPRLRIANTEGLHPSCQCCFRGPGLLATALLANVFRLPLGLAP